MRTIVFPLLFVASLATAQDVPIPSGPRTDAVTEFRMSMRKLWEEHLTYTRNYIISALGDLGDVDAVTQRLMRNQDDIGNSVKGYYGSDAGDKLARLLKQHVQIATEVVKAAKSDRREPLSDALDKWSANARDIAAFLADANPRWSLTAFQDMLQRHLDLTTGVIVARLRKEWAVDIKATDAGHSHLLMLSDALVDGIVRQFPDKFPR